MNAFFAPTWRRHSKRSTPGIAARKSCSAPDPGLRDEAGEDLAVSRGEIFEREFFADAEARVDDRGEHEVEVVALVAGEVGADRAAFAFERVAGGA